MSRLLRAGSALSLFFIFGCSSEPKVVAPSPQASLNLSVNRDPAEITKLGSNDYRVEWCGKTSDAGKKFSLAINGGSNGGGGTVNSSGCIKYTFRDGRVAPGDHIIYQIDGQNRASETVPGSTGGNNGGNNGGGGHNPPAPPVQQRLDIDKVSNEAENRARCTANAIVNIYGRFENYRYHFSQGFRKGIRLYDLSNMGSVRNAPEYQDGNRRGLIEGQKEGSMAGTQQATDAAGTKASQDVRSRYFAIVDRGTSPDLSFEMPRVQYEGAAPSLRQPQTIEERIGNMEDEYRREIQQNSFSYDGGSMRWDTWRPEWNLGYYYQQDYSNELVRSWYREDWAFDLYVRRYFNRCSDGVDYFNQIKNSTLYSNSMAAANAYRRSFKREYDQVIDEKWWNEVSQDNQSARQSGLSYGWRIARNYAYDLGYDNGYRNGFSDGSRESYVSTFGSVYKDKFDAEVQRYETGAVFEVGDLGMYSDGKSPVVHLVGMPVSVLMRQTMNLGRQMGRLEISIIGGKPGSSDVLAIKSQSIEMKPSSALPDETKAGPLGIISPSLDPNADGIASIRAGNLTRNIKFKTDWKTLIATIPTAGITAQKTQLDYVFRFMDKEIKENAGGFWSGNPWEEVNEDKLLKQAALLVQKMPADQKAIFRPLVEKVKGSMGNRPSGIFGGCNKKCQAWESVQGWLNRMM